VLPHFVEARFCPVTVNIVYARQHKSCMIHRAAGLSGGIACRHAILSLCLLQGFLYMALTIVITAVQPVAAYDCSVGFSGIVLALLVMHVESLQEASLSVFGLFDVPRRAYPLVLLLLWQLVVPASSFIGHLAGA
jgi:hypothetical protein